MMRAMRLRQWTCHEAVIRNSFDGNKIVSFLKCMVPLVTRKKDKEGRNLKIVITHKEVLTIYEVRIKVHVDECHKSVILTYDLNTIFNIP